MPVAPDELQGIPTHVVDRRRIHVKDDLLGGERPHAGHLVHTPGTRTKQPKFTGNVLGCYAITPDDPKFGLVFGRPDFGRVVTGIARHQSARQAARARKAAPRWLRASFSSGVISA